MLGTKENMMEESISIIDVAKRLGKRKQTIFKIIKKLGISTKKQRHSKHRGQAIAYITNEDFNQISEYVSKNQNLENTDNDRDINATSPIDHGNFYLIQLEPDHEPGRFKVGFSSNLGERLRDLKCSAPYVKIVSTWPCHRLWEKTAIDCVTVGCRKLHTEVFRTDNLDNVQNKCNQFFALMPKINKAKNDNA